MYFWIPKYKYQYVAWLEKRYPLDKSFKRKNKEQLKAIYINTRIREG